jgi:hypothetical protein
MVSISHAALLWYRWDALPGLGNATVWLVSAHPGL